MSAVYLDCNATTPLEPAVAEVVRRFMERDYGNPASPVHDFGTFARMAVEKARGEVAEVVGARRDEVIFTSGATEANNLAILGLAAYGLATGRRHVIGTRIEHKAVLEPLEELTSRGFEVDLLPVGSDGRVCVEELRALLRPDTLLVTIMHVNNETGIIQPLTDIAAALEGHPAILHTDTAQGFGKDIFPLQSPRIELISISAHKIYGPKGVGALVARKRSGSLLPLRPLMFGGGQEQGLRPGTLPAPLIAGLGTAARLAGRNHLERNEMNRQFRARALAALAPLKPAVNGDPAYALPHAVNLALHGIPAARAIDALKDLVAVSSSSACTAGSTETSHVLAAMGVPRCTADCSIRLAWSHLTPEPDWAGVVALLQSIRAEFTYGG